MQWQKLEERAAQLAAQGKGILAMDESTGTMGKRLASIGVENSDDNRRQWRELLLSAKEALREHIAGAIMFEETLGQKTASGDVPLPELATQAGTLAGIKVDKGLTPLPFHPEETLTQGLDGLRERLVEYRKAGASFAKWRAVLKIGAGMPSRAAIRANANALALYAAICQEEGFVPMVEPEVLMDGTHDIDACFAATEAVLRETYAALAEQGVRLEASILKPNMVCSGADCSTLASVEEVAEKTLACLQRTVPAAVAGIAFLSGGQSEEEASAHLSAINASEGNPWPLTFSYGRALQASALKQWGGKQEAIAKAQAIFAHRARMNGLAAEGKYRPALEQQSS